MCLVAFISHTFDHTCVIIVREKKIYIDFPSSEVCCQTSLDKITKSHWFLFLQGSQEITVYQTTVIHMRFPSFLFSFIFSRNMKIIGWEPLC